MRKLRKPCRGVALQLAGDDAVSAAQAHCILGEYDFIMGKYSGAREHLAWITARAQDLEQEYDDLLHREINGANVLLELMERYALAALQERTL